MPDTRTRRGAHPRDAADFAPEALPNLVTATGELCWLLSRGYPKTASLKLVGDRWSLRRRQRAALQRCAASDEECRQRRQREIPPRALAGERLLIDGYNVLLTVEAALGGGLLLLARDGAVRDMAAMSGHYRRVEQTVPALTRIAGFLAAAGVEAAVWYFDRPVSNSGRLRSLIAELAAERGWPWQVELVANPDRTLLAAGDQVVATADSAILDGCRRWSNLARHVVESEVPEAWLVEL